METDSKNPELVFNTTDTSLLINLIKKDNLVALARKEMANRGMDENGVFVGFDASKKIWGSLNICVPNN